jgi:hypothetical protein
VANMASNNAVILNKLGANLSEVSYTDDIGRKFVMLIAPDQSAEHGVLKGPPMEIYDELINRGVSHELAITTHNELCDRRLLTNHDIVARPTEVFAAWQAACKTSVQAIMACYTKEYAETPPTNSRSQRSNLIPRRRG